MLVQVAVPCVLITSCHIVSSIVMLINVEVEGVSAGASIIVCIVVSVGSTLVVEDIMPCVLLAGILVIGVMRTIVNCQVESVNVSTG